MPTLILFVLLLAKGFTRTLVTHTGDDPSAALEYRSGNAPL